MLMFVGQVAHNPLYNYKCMQKSIAMLWISNLVYPRLVDIIVKSNNIKFGALKKCGQATACVAYMAYEACTAPIALFMQENKITVANITLGQSLSG